MPKTICIIGAFDTKGEDHAFSRQELLKLGHQVLTINIGVLGTTTLFPVDFEAAEALESVGIDLNQIRAQGDKAAAMKALDQGAPNLVRRLCEQGKFSGIIGMGVSGGGAISGMVKTEPPPTGEDRPIITASMFGNTTDCVNACVKSLNEKGFEVLVFHATGAGGRAMETLVADGLVEAVLDITTTEWADELCQGVFSAGPERLEAPGRSGVPHLIVPGCVDMANFGAPSTVPERF